MKWRTRQPANVDKILATHTTHSVPSTFDLIDDRGSIRASVRNAAGVWRYWLAGSGDYSGAFESKDAAKTAARKRVEAK